MTISQADPQPSNATRFLLLANLCRKLGELGCASSLLNPSAGGAVLRVDCHAVRPNGVSVAAVERSDGWAYAWDGRWTPVDRVEQLAARLAGTVSP